jgi:hypothetical protein
MTIVYLFNNKENIKYDKINKDSGINNLQNDVIKINDLLWYDNVSL